MTENCDYDKEEARRDGLYGLARAFQGARRKIEWRDKKKRIHNTEYDTAIEFYEAQKTVNKWKNTQPRIQRIWNRAYEDVFGYTCKGPLETNDPWKKGKFKRENY